MFRPLIKRLCHHYTKDIVYLPKHSNPLIECESKCSTPFIEKNITPIVEETKIYVDNNSFIHSQNKYLPIQIQYMIDNKIYKIFIHLSN